MDILRTHPLSRKTDPQTKRICNIRIHKDHAPKPSYVSYHFHFLMSFPKMKSYFRCDSQRRRYSYTVISNRAIPKKTVTQGSPSKGGYRTTSSFRSFSPHFSSRVPIPIHRHSFLRYRYKMETSYPIPHHSPYFFFFCQL